MCVSQRLLHNVIVSDDLVENGATLRIYDTAGLRDTLCLASHVNDASDSYFLQLSSEKGIFWDFQGRVSRESFQCQSLPRRAEKN